MLKDSLPAGLMFNQAIPSAGSYDPVTKVWTISSLNSGAQVNLVLVTKAVQVGEYINLAKIISSGQPDNVPENNQDTAKVTITQPTVQTMITDLMTKVQDFLKNGVMRYFPAADLMTTLNVALNQVNHSNPNGAIQQLQCSSPS
jgi:hypothetical protein